MANETDSLELLSHQPKNAKSAIVQKLSKQWPLTIKQINHSLQREYGLTITYQGVHKALQELEKEKIVQKSSMGYQLHEDWITNINQMATSIAQNYTRNQPLDFEKEIMQFNFPNWISIGRFVAFQYDTEYPNPQNKPTAYYLIHVWPVISISAEEGNALQKKYDKEPHYCLSPHNTPLDQAMMALLSKIGKICKAGVNTPLDCDYVIRGDYICQIHYPAAFMEEIHQFYLETKSVEKMDYKKLNEITTKKIDIPVVIIHNPTLADQLRKKALTFFEEKEKKTSEP